MSTTPLTRPSMGADPKHKDLFIQADYMATAYVATGDHTHKLNLAALAGDIDAYWREAPPRKMEESSFQKRQLRSGRRRRAAAFRCMAVPLPRS